MEYKLLIYLGEDHKKYELLNIVLISKAERLEIVRAHLYGDEKSLAGNDISIC